MSKILGDVEEKDIMVSITRIYEQIEKIKKELDELHEKAGNICNLVKCSDEANSFQEKESIWDIKFIKDGETIEVVDTYASADACRMELVYYRSKPGIGVRYFMEKRR